MESVNVLRFHCCRKVSSAREDRSHEIPLLSPCAGNFSPTVMCRSIDQGANRGRYEHIFNSCVVLLILAIQI
jgi:hypothetical protein